MSLGTTVRKQPLRQCIGCGQMKDKRELIRIIRDAEGNILLDTTGKKNGRGAYICSDEKCFCKVMKTKGLDRAFKMNVEPSVYEKLSEEFLNNESK